jgi:FtsZ-interacting cell division protein ZipA
MFYNGIIIIIIIIIISIIIVVNFWNEQKAQLFKL